MASTNRVWRRAQDDQDNHTPYESYSLFTAGGADVLVMVESSSATSVAFFVPQPEEMLQSATTDSPFDEPMTVTFDAGRALPGNGTLLAPVAVRLERSDDSFAVTAEVIPLFGEGETPSEALTDFLSQLVPHLRWLEEQEASLEMGMLIELADLRRYVRAA